MTGETPLLEVRDVSLSFRGVRALSHVTFSVSRGELFSIIGPNGVTRLEWQKLRERNEALDCRVYARAAAWIAGADRWHERKWRELEAQVTPDTHDEETTASEHGADETLARAGRLAATPRRGRRVFRSSYMS